MTEEERDAVLTLTGRASYSTAERKAALKIIRRAAFERGVKAAREADCAKLCHMCSSNQPICDKTFHVHPTQAIQCQAWRIRLLPLPEMD